MSLIEGIGDEVLQFFVLFILLIIAIVGWWSTQTSERHLIRTVVILERRGAAQTAGETPIPPAEPAPDEENNKSENPPSVDQPEELINSETTNVEVSEAAGSAQRDLDVELQNESVNSESDSRHCTSTNEMNESISNIEELNDESVLEEPSETNQRSIRIRLKYLNDEQKLVVGNLEEQLGDFKRRHFNLEISGRKLVRLIFNGQLLGQDSCTLGHYGLFDNCVVHCLVHVPRTPPPSPNLNARPGSQRQGPVSAWALSNILLASFSVLLGLAWYGRFQYAQLYTATTTLALIGLTAIFTVSLIGIYITDDPPQT